MNTHNIFLCILFIGASPASAQLLSTGTSKATPSFTAQFGADPDRTTGVRADTNFNFDNPAYNDDAGYYLYDIRAKINISLSPSSYNTQSNLDNVTLKVVKLRHGQSYAPTGIGNIYGGSTGGWYYNAYKEPQSSSNPLPKQAVLEASYKGHRIGTYSLWVYPIFSWITKAHKHGPSETSGYTQGNGDVHSSPTNAEYNIAWNYAQWKYGIVTGNTSDIAFDQGVTDYGITSLAKVPYPHTYIRLGLPAFQSENVCASTIGHENVHAGQSKWMFFKPSPAGSQAEKDYEGPAYQWEYDNKNVTKLPADQVARVQEWLNYCYHNGPRPSSQ